MQRFSPTLFLPIALLVVVAGVFLLFRTAQRPGAQVEALTPTEAFRSEVVVGPSGSFGSASEIESPTATGVPTLDAGILPSLTPASAATEVAAAPLNIGTPTRLPPSATPTPTPLPPEGYCSASTLTGAAVNIRQYASLSAPIVGALYPGTYLQVLAQSGTGWYEVFIPPGAGWVAASVTALHGPCDNLPLPTATLEATGDGQGQQFTSPTPPPTQIGDGCAIPYFFVASERLQGLCPNTSPVNVSALYQRFEHGYMLWDSQTNLVSTIADDGPNGWPVKFTIETPGGEVETPPDGLFAPEGVFKAVWVNYGYKDTFGWATGPAVSYTTPFQTVESPIFIALMRLPGSGTVMGYTTDSSFAAGTMGGN